MSFQELVLGTFTSVRARVEPKFGQDSFGGITRDGSNSQLSGLAKNSGVGSLVFPGQLGYQKSDLLRRALASAFYDCLILPRPQLAYPSNDGY